MRRFDATPAVVRRAALHRVPSATAGRRLPGGQTNGAGGAMHRTPPAGCLTQEWLLACIGRAGRVPGNEVAGGGNHPNPAGRSLSE